ncbi:MAG: hypothetical protein Q8O67_08200 [Deltaproteobacteria bacterium]|nr:hypothetical protein [Deltaproteobacteria bacterium]
MVLALGPDAHRATLRSTAAGLGCVLLALVIACWATAAFHSMLDDIERIEDQG